MDRYQELLDIADRMKELMSGLHESKTLVVDAGLATSLQDRAAELIEPLLARLSLSGLVTIGEEREEGMVIYHPVGTEIRQDGVGVTLLIEQPCTEESTAAQDGDSSREAVAGMINALADSEADEDLRVSFERHVSEELRAALGTIIGLRNQLYDEETRGRYVQLKEEAEIVAVPFLGLLASAGILNTVHVYKDGADFDESEPSVYNVAGVNSGEYGVFLVAQGRQRRARRR